ncbi:MAG: hypothetical protein GY696_34145 [Gammaproteobacteria bacterium]|nr:hypothetical protein [Gammaproteobacteria bacterium]
MSMLRAHPTCRLLATRRSLESEIPSWQLPVTFEFEQEPGLEPLIAGWQYARDVRLRPLDHQADLVATLRGRKESTGQKTLESQNENGVFVSYFNRKSFLFPENTGSGLFISRRESVTVTNRTVTVTIANLGVHHTDGMGHQDHQHA